MKMNSLIICLLIPSARTIFFATLSISILFLNADQVLAQNYQSDIGQDNLRPLFDWTPKQQTFTCDVVADNRETGKITIDLSGSRPYPMDSRDFSRNVFNQYRLKRTEAVVAIQKDSLGLFSAWPSEIKKEGFFGRNGAYQGEDIVFHDPKSQFRHKIAFSRPDGKFSKSYEGIMKITILRSDVSQEEETQVENLARSRGFAPLTIQFWDDIAVGFCDIYTVDQKIVTEIEARSLKDSQ